MKILVSACLLGCRCKYSGGDNFCPAVAALGEKHSLIPLCPEQLGGLPTPRVPAERRGDRVVTQDGRDVTAEYQKGAEEALGLARVLGAEGAVLKARSPSCGCGGIYDGGFTHTVVPGDGMAAEALRKAGIAVCTELDLGEGGGLPFEAAGSACDDSGR